MAMMIEKGRRNLDEEVAAPNVKIANIVVIDDEMKRIEVRIDIETRIVAAEGRFLLLLFISIFILLLQG